MNVLFYVLLAIALLFLGFLVAWLLVIIFKEKIQEEDNPIALNFLAKRSNGKFIIEETKRTTGKGGRHIVIGLPKDISVNNKDKIESQEIIVDVNKVLSIPKGALSKDRNINIYLPANLDDVDSTLKDTVFGKALVMMTMLQDLQTTVETILREGTMRRDLLLKKIGDGEISKEYLDMENEMVKDFLTKIVNPKDVQKDKPPISTNINPSTM